MNIKLPEKMTMVLTKVKFNIKQSSPEILLVTGLVCMGGAIVSAVIASRKHDEILVDHEIRLDDAKLDTLEEVEYTEEELEDGESGTHYVVNEKARRTAVAKCYMITGLKFVKLYAPTVAFMGLSTASFIGMHNIQAGRIAGLTGAYTGLKEAFERYQENNIKLNGQESHELCKYGWEEETKEGKNGKTVTKKKLNDITPENSNGKYIFEFCAPSLVDGTGNKFKGTTSFTGKPYTDRIFIEAQEKFMNDRLKAGFPVLLNDCLDALGLDRTVDGMVLGWLPDDEKRIEFNISMPCNRDFLNAKLGSTCMIEFNVQDVVYNQKTRW